MSTLTVTNNVAAVADMYDAFGRADIAYIVDQIDDNCKWIGAGKGFLPQGGEYKGKDTVNFFILLNENVEFGSFNPISINSINDNEVVAFGNMTTTSRATGKSSSSDWAMHWKFNEAGKVIFYQDFHDTAAEHAANQP
jgi:ketosteroid isomerase-like protein